MPIEKLGRKEIREFLDWVYDLAVAEHGTNPGRTANKAREHLRAVISWAWGSAAWLQQSLRASVRHTDARWATRDRRNAIERAKKSSRVAHTEKRPIAVLCADASKAGVGTMIRNNNPRTSPKNRCG
jgi:hypothetical protein